MTTPRPALALALLATLALGACGKEKGNSLDAIDRELAGDAGNGAASDPALTSALGDQIMVDPALAQQSGEHSARGPVGPAQTPVPPSAPTSPTPEPGLMRAPAPRPARGAGTTTLGELADLQASRGGNPACMPNVRFSASWAARLPEAMPIFPQAEVLEAAGNDASGCALRLVTFRTGAPVQQVLDWYYTRARRAGFSAEHQLDGGEHILAGTKTQGEAAYYIVVRRAGNATEADLIVSNAG
jgi:hypothetical protein